MIIVQAWADLFRFFGQIHHFKYFLLAGRGYGLAGQSTAAECAPGSPHRDGTVILLLFALQFALNFWHFGPGIAVCLHQAGRPECDEGLCKLKTWTLSIWSLSAFVALVSPTICLCGKTFWRALFIVQPVPGKPLSEKVLWVFFFYIRDIMRHFL